MCSGVVVIRLYLMVQNVNNFQVSLTLNCLSYLLDITGWNRLHHLQYRILQNSMTFRRIGIEAIQS